MSLRPSEFDEPFLDVVRRVMRRSYDLARDYYDPEIGVDGQIFAFTVYKIAARQFELELSAFAGAEIVWNRRGREIRRGSKQLRWHKVGVSGSDSIATSFPSHSRSAGVMAELNMEQLDLGLTEEDPSNWIIAHAGNPADGLCALYLAAPNRASRGRVTGWLRWIAIFDSDQPGESYPTLPPPGPIEPLPSDLGDFDLELLEETEDDRVRG
jgi:hypothetical protein